MKKSRYDKVRRALICLSLFIGIAAVIGSLFMFIDPTGKLLKMDTLLQYFEVLPFANILYQNYIFPGIALFIVNGITNITASVFLIKKKKIGYILGGIFGITLMLWITIQFVIFPTNVLSISFFVLGLIELLLAYMCYVWQKQESYVVDKEKYINVGKNSKQLVIYFSRIGYTKKLAYEIANKTGAEILELKTKEKTDGTLGFWWCGRFGMHKWPMELIDIKNNIENYEKITICTPIWVFGMSAPVRAFCMKYVGEVKNVDYVFTHFMKANFKHVADEMDSILKVTRQKVVSICVRIGNVISYKEI